MMKAEFKREQNRNYMIFRGELQGMGSYAAKMLSGNTIIGLIPFFCKQIDGEMQYYYDITSKQPLERILTGRSVTGDEIRKLVSDIIFTVSEMERYFLAEDQLFLEPEYIYIEPDNFQSYLCLLPGRKADFSESFRALAQYLLDHVNHDDSEAVVLAFGIFRQSQKINFGIEDIAKCLPKTEKKEENTEEGEQERSEHPLADRQDLKLPEVTDRPVRNTPERQENRSKGTGFRGWLQGILSLFTGKKRSYRKEKPQPQYEFPDEDKFWEIEFRENAGQTEEKADSFPWEEPAAGTEPDETEMQTVLLTAGPPDEESRRLIPLSGGEEIRIGYFPFIIGKSKTLSDFCIDGPEVSRLHLKIEKNETGYQAVDLNSTNGTRINGRLLEANETCALRAGDEISIASHKYRFR